MSIPPVGSSRQGTYEGPRGGQLPQLPVGTLLSAQILARLENNFLRLMTQFGPLLVQGDAATAEQLPSSGTLHLAVAGHEKGAIQLHVLPEAGARPGGQLPLLREVTLSAGQKASQGIPQAGQSAAAPPTPAQAPVQGARQPLPTLQPGMQIPATLVSSGGEQRLVTPLGAFRLEGPLPFPPESKLVLIPLPGGQGVRIAPLTAPAAGPQTNPYQAAASQGTPQPLLARAVDVPLDVLKPVVQPQNDVSGTRAVVEAATKAAVLSQASAVPLFQSLDAIVRTPPQVPQGAALAALAAQVLGLRLSPEEGLTAEKLKAAFQRSGTGHEALLARGQPQVASGDLKSLLMRLLDGLKTVPEARQPAGHPPRQAEAARPLPPQRDTLFEAPPSQLGRAGLPAQPPLPAQLAQEAEDALSRLRLLQLASLPEGGEQRPEVAGREASLARREFQLEIPLALQGGRTTMMQVHVQNEGRGGQGSDPQEGRDWRFSFSLQLGAQGAVNAQVNMRLARFGILLWAEDAELRAEMRENIPRLGAALREMHMDVAELEIRRFPLPHASGQRPGSFMDALS